MRRLLCITFGLLMVGCDPLPVKGEGVLHPRTASPSLKNYRNDCRPGRDPDDPGCCANTLAICRITCQDDYAANGDMLYLRHCLRECEAELKLCKGRR